MKQLPVPVREVLDDAMPEAASQRIWREVDRRRARRSEAAPRAVPRFAWALAALAAVLVVVAWRGLGLSPTGDPAPLRLAGGAELMLPQLPEHAAATTAALDDGSRVTVFPGAQLAVLENSGRVLTLLLERGRARFEVTPGGPRRWSIECGVLTVEVVGTRFEIERRESSARVTVDEGVVLVRGDTIRDRVQRLGAATSLEVDVPRSSAGTVEGRPAEPPGSEAPPAAEGPGAPPVSTPSAGTPIAGASSARAPAGAWRELARQGAYKEAYGVLGRQGIAEETGRATLDELMQLADVARNSGHPADAVAPLARVVAEHRGDSRCSMAAFTLARLRLDQLGQPAAAAHDFADAIALGLPSGLVEDAHARLVEARARAGDRAGAGAAAAEYERRFPNGRRLQAVRAWAAE